ncbi:unnamed protein product [Ilex paraguariensis]|uniref:Uncharacterized protein n=1 Tax=Ilex paraguariensis TaxID=185542 RepID=A0ABC8S8Z7_9AQUA
MVDRGCWDYAKLIDLFLDFDVKDILFIPLCEDLLADSHVSRGPMSFELRSGYYLIMEHGLHRQQSSLVLRAVVPMWMGIISCGTYLFLAKLRFLRGSFFLIFCLFKLISFRGKSQLRMNVSFVVIIKNR